MKKSIFVFLVAILAVAFVANFVSAGSLSIDIPSVKVNGIRLNNGASLSDANVSVLSGKTYPVELGFESHENASDVTISAWIQGERNDAVEISYMDLIESQHYNPRLSVVIPEDIEVDEKLTLIVRIETDSGSYEAEWPLYAQRESHNIEVLLANIDNSAKAGSTVPVEIVLKNMGRHEAEDTLVKVEIPELGVSTTSYFDDLATEDSCDDDDDDCDEVDSSRGKIYLNIPSDASEGTYEVRITAYTDDTETIVSKSLKIVGSNVEGSVLSNPSSKTFAVGEQVAYDLALVNTGNEITVYTLTPLESDALSISLSDSIAIVPAGSSKTVKVYVTANREGTYNFAVSANAEDFSQTASYTANVEGKTISNNVVALTIVLAIIFVILVVILAILLTRKTEKSEEFGESYY